MVECIGSDLEEIGKDSIYKLLKSKGYKIVGKTYRTVIFKRH